MDFWRFKNINNPKLTLQVLAADLTENDECHAVEPRANVSHHPQQKAKLKSTSSSTPRNNINVEISDSQNMGCSIIVNTFWKIITLSQHCCIVISPRKKIITVRWNIIMGYESGWELRWVSTHLQGVNKVLNEEEAAHLCDETDRVRSHHVSQLMDSVRRNGHLLL